MAAVPLTFDVSEEPKRKVWTREEVQSLEEMGFFAGQRYELIGGELIDKIGQKPPHASSVMIVAQFVSQFFGLKRLRIQLPIEVAQEDRKTNEPDPDIAVTRGVTEDYLDHHPLGTELTLLIEISDTSLRMDRLTKAALYARAGVPGYWVLDIIRRMLVVHREPVDGAYREVRQFDETERLSLGSGDVEVRQLLPPQ